MRLSLLTFGAAVLLGSGSAFAQTAPTQPPGSLSKPQVTVAVGQALQLNAGEYGQAAVKQLADDLAQTVGRALAHSRTNSLLEAHLVLESATPTRPTAAQLGSNAGLSERSIGLGGAWIDGYVVTAANQKRPISYSFYETDLRNELAPTMWSDAERAFDMLAAQLSHGKYPQQAGAAPTQASFAQWPR